MGSERGRLATAYLARTCQRRATSTLGVGSLLCAQVMANGPGRAEWQR